MQPRRIFFAAFAIFAAFAFLVSTTRAQSPAITIKAAAAFDGKGRSIPNAVIVVRDGKIVSVTSEPAGAATYDLRNVTILPGLIDTHVHLDTHFGPDGRASTRGETPAQSTMYEAENAYTTLAAGFTTVQSLGSPLDVEIRAAIARGVLPGPRLLTSIRPINENTGTPDQIRAFVQKAQSRRRRSREAVRVEEQPRGRYADDDRRADPGGVRGGQGGRAAIVGARAQPLVCPCRRRSPGARP